MQNIMIPGERNPYLVVVLFAPNMRCNLIFIPRLDDKGYELHFHGRKVSIGNFLEFLCGGLILMNFIDLIFLLIIKRH